MLPLSRSGCHTAPARPESLPLHVPAGPDRLFLPAGPNLLSCKCGKVESRRRESFRRGLLMARNLLILGGSRTAKNARNALVGDTMVKPSFGCHAGGSLGLGRPFALKKRFLRIEDFGESFSESSEVRAAFSQRDRLIAHLSERHDCSRLAGWLFDYSRMKTRWWIGQNIRRLQIPDVSLH
jgi:hypothetical protein